MIGPGNPSPEPPRNPFLCPADVPNVEPGSQSKPNEPSNEQLLCLLLGAVVSLVDAMKQGNLLMLEVIQQHRDMAQALSEIDEHDEDDRPRTYLDGSPRED